MSATVQAPVVPSMTTFREYQAYVQGLVVQVLTESREEVLLNAEIAARVRAKITKDTKWDPGSEGSDVLFALGHLEERGVAVWVDAWHWRLK